MPTARVLRTQWVYDREFDNKLDELKNLSERAASYLLHDPEVKYIYRENVRNAISYLSNEFHKKGDYSIDYRNDRDNIYNGLIYLYEGENAAYQRARRKDWSIYEATAKFENNGFLFYAKETLQVLGGVVQLAGGIVTFRTGTVIKSGFLKGIGMLAMSVGASNAVENGLSIIYEITEGKHGNMDANILKNMMGDVTEYLGYSHRGGELAYKTIDFGVSMFLTFGTLVKLNDPRRILNLPFESKGGLIYPNLIDRMINPKGGFFLMSALRSDFSSKLSQMSKPAFLYNASMAGYKAKLLLSEYDRK